MAHCGAVGWKGILCSSQWEGNTAHSSNFPWTEPAHCNPTFQSFLLNEVSLLVVTSTLELRHKCIPTNAVLSGLLAFYISVPLCLPATSLLVISHRYFLWTDKKNADKATLTADQRMVISKGQRIEAILLAPLDKRDLRTQNGIVGLDHYWMTFNDRHSMTGDKIPNIFMLYLPVDFIPCRQSRCKNYFLSWG
jgi:hypothetical protein